MTMERDSLVARLVDKYAASIYGRIVGIPDHVIRQQFAEFADEVAALSRHEQVVPPAPERPTSDAWKLVPVEPTEEMIEAGGRSVFTREIWCDMLASAPASQAIQAVADSEYVVGSPADFFVLLRDFAAPFEGDIPRLSLSRLARELSKKYRPALSALHPAPEAASAGAAKTDGDLENRLRSAHDAFAALEGVANDDLVAVLDAADFLASDTAPSPKGVSDGVRAALSALRAVNKIVSEAAMTGFNWKDGDWADRLFHSQRATSTAIRTLAALSQEPVPATAEERAASKEGA